MDEVDERNKLQQDIQQIHEVLSADEASEDEDDILEEVYDDGEELQIVEGSAAAENEQQVEEQEPEPPPIRSLLIRNREYQELLETLLNQVQQALENNQTEQKEIEKIMLVGAPFDGISNLPKRPYVRPMASFFKGYFKDEDGNTPLPNSEAVERKASMQQDPYVTPRSFWSTEEIKWLKEGVQNDRLRRVQQPLWNKIELLQDKLNHPELDDAEKEKIEDQIEELEHRIAGAQSSSGGGSGSKSFNPGIDWMRIASMDLDGERTPFECQQQWEVLQSAELNKGNWTSKEQTKLLMLAEKYQERDWVKIASELGSDRSPFQCIQQYRTNLCNNFAKSTFSKVEDEQLKRLVARFRHGNYIPYTKVAYFMGNHTHKQICMRWTNTLSPDIRSGRWQEEEDELLRQTVKKYGQKWSTVSQHIPGRTSAQVRDRYCLHLDNKLKRGSWTPEEDLNMVKLIMKHGLGNWLAVSKEMYQDKESSRSRNSMLVRFRNMVSKLRKSGKISKNDIPTNEVLEKLREAKELECKEKEQEWIQALADADVNEEEEDDDESYRPKKKKTPRKPKTPKVKKPKRSERAPIRKSSRESKKIAPIVENGLDEDEEEDAQYGEVEPKKVGRPGRPKGNRGKKPKTEEEAMLEDNIIELLKPTTHKGIRRKTKTMKKPKEKAKLSKNNKAAYAMLLKVYDVKVKEGSRVVENMMGIKSPHPASRIRGQTSASSRSPSQSREGTPLRSLDNLTAGSAPATAAKTLDTPATDLLQQLMNREQAQSTKVVSEHDGNNMRQSGVNASQEGDKDMTSARVSQESSDLPLSEEHAFIPPSAAVQVSTPTAGVSIVAANTLDRPADGVGDQAQKPHETITLKLTVDSDGNILGSKEAMTSEGMQVQEATFTSLKIPDATPTPAVVTSPGPVPDPASIPTPSLPPPAASTEEDDRSDDEMASFGGDVHMSSDSEFEEVSQPHTIPDESVIDKEVLPARVKMEQKVFDSQASAVGEPTVTMISQPSQDQVAEVREGLPEESVKEAPSISSVESQETIPVEAEIATSSITDPGEPLSNDATSVVTTVAQSVAASIIPVTTDFSEPPSPVAAAEENASDIPAVVSSDPYMEQAVSVADVSVTSTPNVDTTTRDTPSDIMTPISSQAHTTEVHGSLIDPVSGASLVESVKETSPAAVSPGISPSTPAGISVNTPDASTTPVTPAISSITTPAALLDTSVAAATPTISPAPVMIATPETHATYVEPVEQTSPMVPAVPVVSTIPTIPGVPVVSTTSVLPAATSVTQATIIPAAPVVSTTLPVAPSAPAVVPAATSALPMDTSTIAITATPALQGTSAGGSTITSAQVLSAPLVKPVPRLPAPVPVAIHLATSAAKLTQSQLQQVIQQTPQKQIYSTPGSSTLLPSTPVLRPPISVVASATPALQQPPASTLVPAAPVQPSLASSLVPTPAPLASSIVPSPTPLVSSLVPGTPAATLVPASTPVQTPTASMIIPATGTPFQQPLALSSMPATPIQPPQVSALPPGTPLQPTPTGLQSLPSTPGIMPSTPVTPTPPGTPLLSHLASVVQQGGQLQPISSPMGAIQQPNMMGVMGQPNMMGNVQGTPGQQNVIVVGSAPAVPVFIPGLGYMYGFMPGSMQLTPAGLTTNQWSTNTLMGNAQPGGVQQVIMPNAQQPMMMMPRPGFPQAGFGTPQQMVGFPPGMMAGGASNMAITPNMQPTTPMANAPPQPANSLATVASIQTTNVVTPPGVAPSPSISAQSPSPAQPMQAVNQPPLVPVTQVSSVPIMHTSVQESTGPQRPTTAAMPMAPESDTLGFSEHEPPPVEQDDGDLSAESGIEQLEEPEPSVNQERLEKTQDLTSSATPLRSFSEWNAQQRGTITVQVNNSGVIQTGNSIEDTRKRNVQVLFADGSSKIKVKTDVPKRQRKGNTPTVREVRRRLQPVPEFEGGGLSSVLPTLGNTDGISSCLPKLTDSSSANQMDKIRKTVVPVSLVTTPVRSTRNLANLPQQISSSTSQVPSRQIRLVTLPPSFQSGVQSRQNLPGSTSVYHSAHRVVASQAAQKTSLHPLPNVRPVTSVLPPSGVQSSIRTQKVRTPQSSQHSIPVTIMRAQPIDATQQKARILRPGSTNGKPPPTPMPNIPGGNPIRPNISGMPTVSGMPGRPQVRMLRPVTGAQRTVAGIPVKRFAGKKMPSHMQDNSNDNQDSVDTHAQNSNPSSSHQQQQQSSSETSQPDLSFGIQYDPVAGMIIHRDVVTGRTTVTFRKQVLPSSSLQSPPPLQRTPLQVSQNTQASPQVRLLTPHMKEKMAELNQMAEQVLGADATDEKSIPLLPPNSATLMALKSLLLQRKMLEKNASGYRSAGHGVMSLEKAKWYQGYMASKSQEVDNSAQQSEGAGTSADEPHPLAHVLATRDFKRLQERFMSVFAWLALLSTVPPRSKAKRKAIERTRTDAADSEHLTVRKRNAKHLQESASTSQEPAAKVPKPSESNQP